MGLFSKNKQAEVEARPLELSLSGEHLKHAFEKLLEGAEEQGGIERFTYALQARRDVFKESFNFESPAIPDAHTLMALCSFMPTVRRRIAPYLEKPTKFEILKEALLKLQDGALDTTTADARIDEFCRAFPENKEHRWVKDMAAEVLHGTDPERYPLMCRWVWDGATNTGVLREIWHADNIDHQIIDVKDTYDTFSTLRQELSQYMSENGVYKDMLQLIDLLFAQIYAGYICDHGNTYIRADFSNPEDPMMHIRRLLGLDGVSAKGKSRLKTLEGHSVTFDTTNALN